MNPLLTACVLRTLQAVYSRICVQLDKVFSWQWALLLCFYSLNGVNALIIILQVYIIFVHKYMWMQLYTQTHTHGPQTQSLQGPCTNMDTQVLSQTDTVHSCLVSSMTAHTPRSQGPPPHTYVPTYTQTHTMQERQYSSSLHHTHVHTCTHTHRLHTQTHMYLQYKEGSTLVHPTTHMYTLGHAMYVLFYDCTHRQSVT